MSACGQCGKSVGNGDTTCPHCGAVLAAWAPVAGVGESTSHVQPDYARPPTERSAPLTTDTVIDKAAATGLVTTIQTLDRTTATNVVNILHAMERSTAQRLVSTIKLYARKREAEANRARSSASRERDIAPSGSNPNLQISNIAFAIGTFLVVFLVIMCGIVAAMVFDDMLSIEFITITIVLTFAFKPTMSTIRRSFPR